MVTILLGKSGSGKDAIVKKLLESNDTAKRVVSVTTRPMRPGEINGFHYHFVSYDEFQELIKKNMLLEYRSYETTVDDVPDTWYYGTTLSEFLDKDSDVVVIKDAFGAKEIADFCKKVNVHCVSIYIDVDDDVRTSRAMKRPGFDLSEWNRRMIADEHDFKDVDSLLPYLYHVKNNGSLESSYAEVVDILKAEKVLEVILSA